MNNSIFCAEASAVIERLYQDSIKLGVYIPLHVIAAVTNGVVALGVLIFEFEIMYKLFSQLAGNDHKYWSPAVLGMSAFILVAAIHYVAEMNRNHIALRLLNKAAGLLIPIYLIGIGLVLASLLFNIGINEFLDANSDSFSYEDLMAGGDDDLITMIMQSFVSPVAGGIFSLGIGALAVINVFVSHHAISKATDYVFQIKANRHVLKISKTNYDAYQAAKSRDEELELQIMTLELEDQEFLTNEVAGDILTAIRKASGPVQKALKNSLFVTDGYDFLPHTELNTKEIEKVVKAIDAITFETIKKQIKE